MRDPSDGGDPYAGRGVERVTLLGAAGHGVAVVTPLERGGRLWADLVWLPSREARAAAARALVDAYAGGSASVEDPALRDALLAAGAEPGRHALVLSRDLRAEPPPAAWADEPLPGGALLQHLPPDDAAAAAEGIAAVRRVAYGSSHPDHVAASSPELAREAVELLAGRRLGPLLPGSSVAVDAAGRAPRTVGYVLLTDRPGRPPVGGPWVADVARDPAPRWAGLGAVLLRGAVARAASDGRRVVTLVVTAGNPAERVYQRLGFHRSTETWTLRLPGPS